MLFKTTWTITAAYRQSQIEKFFPSLSKVFDFSSGKKISFDSDSQVDKVAVDGTSFYIKRYFRTRGLRSWLGYSRVRGEWKNLLLFQHLRIPTAPVVAYGETYIAGYTLKGALITEEIRDVSSLSDLYQSDSHLLHNRQWVYAVIKQVAAATKKMHRHRFAHNDLKWRNILVTHNEDNPQVYFIDCPSGMRWPWPLLKGRILKDLACLDKVAHKCLSNTTRLFFYKQYNEITRLRKKDRKNIHKIIHYFRGRD